MLSATIRAAVLSFGIAALLATPAAQADPPKVIETPVSIPASLPDDEGNPVVLDGGVDFPEGGCADRACPGVIINHGFTGRWQDSRRTAEELASYGYVVLRYSSRGFGETPGEVDLMGPKERQDLLDAVHWLNDASSPIVGGMVQHNSIGQFGGSYGGAHAWSLALANDPAVRTVVPTATWTDIYDALLPNDVELLAYANGFYATGFSPTASAIEGELSTTGNYSKNMHRWVAQANAGIDLDGLQADLVSRSVTGRFGNINIPVFIIQGTNDGLFNQNQAVDAYRTLAARGVPARLYVGGIGHPPSNGSLDSPEAKHVGLEVLAWFDHYLKGIDNGIDRRAPIEFSRADYFNNTWDGTTRSATSYPFGPATTLHLCSTGPTSGTLSSTPCPAANPVVLANTVAGGGYNQDAATGGYAQDFDDAISEGFGQETKLLTAPSPVPAVTYDSPVLTADLDLAGIPSFDLQIGSVSTLPAGLRGATAAFQLDPKFYDVAPDGSAELITRGAFSERLDAQAPGTTTTPQHRVTFDAFGLSNLVTKGHRLRITLNTEDAPYLKPTPNPFAAVVFTGSTVSLPSGSELSPTP